MIAHALAHGAVADMAGAWARLSLSLPARHAAIETGGASNLAADIAADIAAAPKLNLGDLAVMDLDDRRRVALDVLMVEAFVRRHGGIADRDVQRQLDDAAGAVADALGIQPILTYPLYIRHNPLPPERLRTFTPLAAEARFIRMHRAVEDLLDALIPRLDAVLAQPSAAAFDEAFEAAYPAIADGFRAVNAMMAAFQDPTRMPVADFATGFRPYYASEIDPSSGRVTREGPSGLQSPTFRAIAMQMGYADHGLDHWTTHLAAYHEVDVRDDLNRRRLNRDAGMSMADRFAERFGGAELPRLHPDHAASLPDLLAIATAGGWVDGASVALLTAHGVPMAAWPPDAPQPPAGEVPAPPPVHLADAAFADEPAPVQASLARFAALEAMLFGFHLTHVATAAAQIGRVPGTGGTAGVDFLLIALFRRAFPGLWSTGLGAAAARAGRVSALG